jgi:hypothetical protein
MDDQNHVTYKIPVSEKKPHSTIVAQAEKENTLKSKRFPMGDRGR